MLKSQVFISYSRRDQKWRDMLLEPLRALETNGHFNIWVDSDLEAGDEWQPRIQKAIEDSSAAILLISNSFLSSEFITGEEIPRILKRRKRDGMRVFPVILRPCPWQDITWLSKMQVRPERGRPLVRGSEFDIEQDLADLAREVLRKLKSIEVRAVDPPKKPRSVPEAGIRGTARRRAAKNAIGRRRQVRVVSLESDLRGLPRWLGRLTELQSHFSFDYTSLRLPVRSIGHIEGTRQLKVYRLSDRFQCKMITGSETVAIGVTRETLAFEEGEKVFYNYLAAPSAVNDRIAFLSVAKLAANARRARVSQRTSFAFSLASQLAWQVGGEDYHGPILGCPQDFTADHADRAKGLSKGAFCPGCTKRLGRRKGLLEALQAILAYGR